MTFGNVTLGRLVLREALTPAGESSQAGAARALSLSGQEASPPLTLAAVASVQDDIAGLPGRMLPVTFTDKASRDGWYLIRDAKADLMAWGSEVVTCDWGLSLERVGSASEVDVESRLSGPLTRTNQHSAVGERWHAPPIGHTSYWASSASPTVVTRTGADGAMTVYRGVPINVNTRYAVPLASYGGGRVRFLDAAGRERTGHRFETPAAGWELNNALVRVRWDAGGLRVANHDGTSYAERTYTVTVSTALGVPEQASVIRNDHEAVVVRCMWARAVSGRTTVDLTLRRGARFVEAYVNTTPATTISVALTTPVTTTSVAGYITATSNDAAGDRFWIGSAGTFTADTITSKISKASAVAMDFAVGAVIGGGSAVSGDTAANLLAQYLGSPAEQVSAIRR